MAISKAITGIDNSGSFRVYMAISTSAVQKAAELHHTSPGVTCLLGRALTGTGLMGLMLREPGLRLSLQFKGDGPVRQILCAADSDGCFKGYAAVPDAEIPEREDGSFLLGDALGSGSLVCIRNAPGMEEPYIGQIELISGEIAEDISNYFYQSEQTRTLVDLGVRLDEEGKTEAAAGLIIQLLPDAKEEAVDALEKWMNIMPSISDLALQVTSFDPGQPEEIVMENFLYEMFLGIHPDYAVHPLETLPFQWKCDCSEARLEQVLISLGSKELNQMIEEDGEAEVTCQFCGTRYHFDKSRLQQLSIAAAEHQA